MSDFWLDRVLDSNWFIGSVFVVLGLMFVFLLVLFFGMLFFPDNSHHFYMNCDHRLVLEGKVWVQMWDCTG